MKKLFSGLIAAFVIFVFAGSALAGGCSGIIGECVGPARASEGYFGTSSWRWGYGYFNNGDINTLTVNTAITMPAKVHRIPVNLASVFVDGAGPILSSTAPNLTTVDNVGAIVYDDSTEVAEIQFSWFPDTSFSAMSVKLLVTSDDASGADNSVDWSIFVHGDDVNIPSATAQTHATLTSATLDVSEELVTLTLDATGIAAVTAGTSGVTVAVWNQGTGAAETLEIKAIWIEETRTK